MGKREQKLWNHQQVLISAEDDLETAQHIQEKLSWCERCRLSNGKTKTPKLATKCFKYRHHGSISAQLEHPWSPCVFHLNAGYLSTHLPVLTCQLSDGTWNILKISFTSYWIDLCWANEVVSLGSVEIFRWIYTLDVHDHHMFYLSICSNNYWS